ncbi:hypothetical protein D6C77_06317 [Aureobasidium pullulans]|uniref:DNA-directed RNA polymerase III subunit Rpc5 n=1 Tax=Aureobasidium pullulans TaxID=5580 RepID=A0A4S8SJN2_AURPU|nr:hypothetical protein D6D28_04867 [Aureobasidium pullulans]THW58858.1 hypothetical protein D6D20_06901 [Aureobasidium pullulans]THW87110.1 hypothetical protein D6D18_07389 [Aureobasidium pullulans]THX39902.1 hypothetical protein D6D10_03901 [Aureobasidium pullulans]THY09749.1 hypothetical protein D6D02_06693 [Aureobasidium pullulans]
MSPSRVADVEDDDPVIAEYNVYITPRQLEQIYLLQYPNRNRSQAYNDRNGARPVDFRLKPQAGFMEMDIGMNPSANFNKFQSLVWGEAIRKSKTNGGSATFGAAAGFAPTKGGKGRAKQEGSEMSVDQGLARFQEAVNRDAVYQKQTLGGQILQDEAGNPNYMLGAFRGDELHLTRVDGVVQMRPQFHHVDAITHAETAARRTEAAEGNGPSGPGAAAAAAKQPQALALAQTYKDNRDVENLEALRAKNLLLIAAEEKWTRLEYFDEDEEASYETYHDRLFLKEPGAAPPLKSQMKNEEYLDAISAPRVDPSGRKKKRPLTKKQMERIEAAEDDVEGSGEMGGEVEVEMA